MRERLAKRDANLASGDEVGEADAEVDVEVEGVGEVLGDGAERRIARRTFSRMGILAISVMHLLF